jgi:hypothetical protein
MLFVESAVIAAVVAYLARELVKVLQDKIIVIAVDKVQSKWRETFANRNIAVLGNKESGKTALIYYVQYGKPYVLSNGQVNPPNPTFASVIVGKKFELQKGNWLSIKTDVPGDKALRDTWKDVIANTKPEGIIYMIDGRLPPDKLIQEVDDIFVDVLDVFKDKSAELKVLHIFVNFCDQWATTPKAQREVVRAVQDRFEDKMDYYKRVPDFRFGVSQTQLAPKKSSWPEVDRALLHFGADLVK